MGKIGIFGGTFDPPHIGHIELANRVSERFSLDRFIFIPAGNPPHKTDKNITDKYHRYEMLRLAVSDNPKFEISDFDLNNKNPNYSYVTIEHFKSLYPDDEIFFVVGADSYRDFPLWKNYPDILSACSFIVVNRSGIESQSCYKKYKDISCGHTAFFLNDFSYEISSTELRDALSSGDFLKCDLQQSVLEYIQKNKLYPRSRHD